MKHTLFCFFLFPILLQAQGNLQFNKVINLKYKICGGFNQTCTTPEIYFDTVPSGKVWKIEFELNRSCSRL